MFLQLCHFCAAVPFEAFLQLFFFNCTSHLSHSLKPFSHSAGSFLLSKMIQTVLNKRLNAIETMQMNMTHPSYIPLYQSI